MVLNRGHVVLTAVQGDYGKPRPALVVQSDLFNPTHPSVTVLLITSEIRDAPLFRVTIEPSAHNGLQKVSQIMVDKLVTCPREKLGAPIGRLEDDTMVRINRSLAMWLGLAS